MIENGIKINRNMSKDRLNWRDASGNKESPHPKIKKYMIWDDQQKAQREND